MHPKEILILFIEFASGRDIVKSIANNIATIFNENTRLYEYAFNVNTAINRTAASSNESDIFYFFNTGVVIYDKVENNPSSSFIKLNDASVVNGCQTLTVLYNAYKKNKLHNSVQVLVRIIEISDYSERMKITEYLNTQNPIKSSYFIANHPIVRNIAKRLLGRDVFLERQANEYQYLNEHQNNIKGKR